MEGATGMRALTHALVKWAHPAKTSMHNTCDVVVNVIPIVINKLPNLNSIQPITWDIKQVGPILGSHAWNILKGLGTQVRSIRPLLILRWGPGSTVSRHI